MAIRHCLSATAIRRFTTLTHQSFALEDGRLIPTSELEETVVGNPLDQENLVAWHSIADRQALANMRG